MQKMPSMPSGRGKGTSQLRRSDSGGSGILTIILVSVSIMIFTLSVREGGSGFFSQTQAVVQTIVSPAKVAGAYLVAPFAGAGNIVRNLTADEKTLSELKEENERLQSRNVELEEAAQNAKRLEELLDLRSTYNLQSTAARVISGSTDSWSSTVTIDKGAASGITVGMPVSDSNGAIGQVISTSAANAMVRLLVDDSSSVAAMVQVSRAQGMVEGSPDGTLRLTLIRTDQTVNVGDVVVTSGLGGVFPKGLPIGKVTDVQKNTGATYYDIIVEPFSHPQNLEEVLVITSLTSEQQASSADIDAADAPDLEAAAGKKVRLGELDEESSEDADAGETTAERTDAQEDGGVGDSDAGDRSATRSQEPGAEDATTSGTGTNASGTTATIGGSARSQGDVAYGSDTSLSEDDEGV